jgi:hypothetical protein
MQHGRETIFFYYHFLVKDSDIESDEGEGQYRPGPSPKFQEKKFYMEK